MRPFLSYTVPPTTMRELRDEVFTSVDWWTLVDHLDQESNLVKRETDRQCLGRNASRMAAFHIHNTFPTFNFICKSSRDGYPVQQYGGVYLSAEMVHVGDPVSLRIWQRRGGKGERKNSASDSELDNIVMLVAEIQLSAPSNSPDGYANILVLSGNIYQIVRSHTDDPPADSIPPEVLVPALAEELATYNAIERGATMR